MRLMGRMGPMRPMLIILLFCILNTEFCMLCI
jgi:hypothetical protein